MVLEDAYDGVYQLAHNPELALAFCGTIFSIAFFNFAGVSVTKELSATTRFRNISNILTQTIQYRYLITSDPDPCFTEPDHCIHNP
jgi:hypothetical protein